MSSGQRVSGKRQLAPGSSVSGPLLIQLPIPLIIPLVIPE